ncbi:hypothetical protein F511_04019 [Dorcoceras hygrometricum]|uniref:Uncharacterized protein n=1 Tax=Dorcoceras hygrometricum TaxID=472368 RepID=A0A2Z7A6I4_9LAMI|nr:hypothetical protein F511_04019 [Dorcoceras hygrometricum]
MVDLIPSATHPTGNRASAGDFIQHPRSAFPPLELYESDVVWSFHPSPDSTSPSPPYIHQRRTHNRFSAAQSGLSAVLDDDGRRLVSSQSKIIPASTRSENVRVKFHQSAPVDIPVWPKKFRDNFNEITNTDDDLKRLDEVEEEEEEEEDWKMVPPHVIVARSHVTFSVFEGVGRTLKGRDLRRVRNAVFRKTGQVMSSGCTKQGRNLLLRFCPKMWGADRWTPHDFTFKPLIWLWIRYL